MTQKKLILHIGQTKTGTTSIQSFLNSNQSNLELSGIYYANRPHASISHRYLFHLICASVKDLEGSEFNQRHLDILTKMFKDSSLKTLDQFWEYFKAGLFVESCHTSIISEELLWELGKFEPSYRVEMINLLSKHLKEVVNLENVTIISAVRHHAEWIESWHNQMIKDQGNQVPVKLFLSNEISHYSLNYRKNLDDWKSAFPEATFKVIDFKKVLVSERPIGVNFLESIDLTRALKLETLINFTYPKNLQESIHPLLHAYIVRHKPSIINLIDYKIKVKKASDLTASFAKLLNIDHSYTTMKPELIKTCEEINAGDNLESFGLKELKTNIGKKKQAPRILPKELREHLNKIFF